MTLEERKEHIANTVIAFRDKAGGDMLPPTIVHLVDEYKDAIKSEAEARILEDELRKKQEHLNAEAEKKRLYDQLAHPVQWADKVPLNERFVVMKTRYRYYQCQKLVERDDYCPVDILRKYTAPYFGYYGCGLRHCVIEIMRELFRLNGDALWKFVKSEFTFFKMDGKRDLERKMSIVSYSDGDDGLVKELYVGPPMTIDEHFNNLEMKYGKGER